MAAHDFCSMCGEDVEGRPWVLLNRVVFGSGRSFQMSEFQNEDAEYVWQQDADDEDTSLAASGKLLCFPACLQVYCDGRMIESDFLTGRSE